MVMVRLLLCMMMVWYYHGPNGPLALCYCQSLLPLYIDLLCGLLHNSECYARISTNLIVEQLRI